MIRINLTVVLLVWAGTVLSQNGIDSLLREPLSFSEIDTIEYDSITKRSQVIYIQGDVVIKGITYTGNGSLKEIFFYDEQGVLLRFYSWYENKNPYMQYKLFRGNIYSGYTWYDDGKLWAETIPINDSIKTISYYRTGEIREIRFDKNGQPLHATTYCENGSVISERYWGKQYEYWEYYCDGKKRAHGITNASGFFCGKYIKWDEKGNVLIKGQFADSLISTYTMSGVDGGLGQKIGTWQFFNEKGKLIKEEVYMEGRLQEIRIYKGRKCTVLR